MFFLLLITSTKVFALTLEALVAVYKDNATLQAKREDVKQTDEQIMQALAGWLPQADFTIRKQYQQQIKAKTPVLAPGGGAIIYSLNDQSLDTKISELSINQNLFKGGGDVAAISAARSAIKAAHADLQASEQDIFTKTIVAYTDMLRFYEHYKIAQEKESDSLKSLEGTRQKVAVGTDTKTNLAQIEAEYAGAQATKIRMKSQYETSKASLEAFVGIEVNNVIAPTELLSLPKNMAETIDVALVQNPTLIAKNRNSEATKANITVVRAAVLPKIDLAYTLDNYQQNSNTITAPKISQTVTLALIIPILHVDKWSQLRNQKRAAAEAAYATQDQRDQVRASATSAWSSFESSKAALKAAKNAYEAMKLAYAGTRAQEKVGLIDMFKMIDIRDKYFDSYDQLIEAKTTYYKSLYALKAAVGECTAKGLRLNVPLYDPRDNYNSITRQLIGAF